MRARTHESADRLGEPSAVRLAFALAVLAVESLSNLVGRSLVFLGGLAPSRLLELSVMALLFVIAHQLREIKHLTCGRTGAG